MAEIVGTAHKIAKMIPELTYIEMMVLCQLLANHMLEREEVLKDQLQNSIDEKIEELVSDITEC